MKKNKLVFLLSAHTSRLAFFALSIFTLAGIANAAPMPPRPVINHQTRQCAQIIPGDECGDVVLPPDWEYLDESQGEKCPDGYTSVDLRPEWVHFKAPHCCTEGHSGSRGDCQDVVIQQSRRQCAFVDDIQNCPRLPDGWEILGANCPVDFEWVDEVICLDGEGSQSATLTAAPQTEPVSTAQPLDTPASEPASPVEKRNPLLPCASFGLALIVLLGARFRRL